MLDDVVTLEDDVRDGRALLQQVMHGGLRINPQPSLTEIRDYAALELASLPLPLRELQHEAAYPVLISKPLRNLATALDTENRDS